MTLSGRLFILRALFNCAPLKKMRGLSIIAVVSDQPARPGVTLLQPAVKEPCLTLPMDIRAKAYRIVAVQLAVAAVMALGLWVF